MVEGYSSGGGLGCGLPGVQRLMDEFSIESMPGRGTRVVARKWSREGLRP
jgi:serine/threonine-protein kinase RsbT